MTNHNSEPQVHDLTSQKLAGYIGDLLGAAGAIQERIIRVDDANRLSQIASELQAVIEARGDFDIEEIPQPQAQGYEAPPPAPTPTGSRTLLDLPRGIGNRLSRTLKT